jgi:thiol-disulfide isomerase/thioredoxin
MNKTAIALVLVLILFASCNVDDNGGTSGSSVPPSVLPTGITGKLLYFHASWCRYCPTQSVIIDKIAKENPDMVVEKYDIDDFYSREIVSRYKISGVPHFVFIQNTCVKKDRGFTEYKNLVEWLRQGACSQDGIQAKGAIENSEPSNAKSGCCLNPNEDACTYYKEDLACCPEGVYSDPTGPSDQSQCLSNWFFRYEGEEACAAMPAATYPNAEQCMLGCCCETTPEGGIGAVMDLRLRCTGENSYWGALDEINCTEGGCTDFLKKPNAVEKGVITQTDNSVSQEVCQNTLFEHCVPSPEFTEAIGVPSGARFGGGCLEWTPAETGEFVISFQSVSGDQREKLTIEVVACGSTLELSPITNKIIIAGELLEFKVSANGAGNLTFSAAGLPDGASFNPSNQEFSWKPEIAGEYSIEFSVRNEEGLSYSKVVGIKVEKNMLATGVIAAIVSAALLTVVAFVTGILPGLMAAMGFWPGVIFFSAIATAISVGIAALLTNLR